MTPLVALLRGINVGGHNKIPMHELRSVCSELGWADVRTYIQSGNIVFRSADPPARLETELEEAIERHFALSIPVVVRSEVDWEGYIASNPYPEASQTEPNLVMLALSKARPKQAAVAEIQTRSLNNEQVVKSGDVLWLYFPRGAGRSRITPTLLDRAAGSAVTMRNWRTVLQLHHLLRAAK